ncbi:MAG: phytoene desaturase family protein [Candidatus Peregrinibacteria bacterium]
MQKNIGKSGRLARLALALALGIGVFFTDSIIVQIGLASFSIFVLYEALVGWCAWYAIIGKNTCPIPFQNTAQQQKKKIIIIGAGPGGLSAGMILAHRGYDVEIFERHDEVGGRNAPIRINGYTFDVRPTFVMLPQVFADIFSLAGRDYYRELDIIPLETLYRLRYSDGRDFFVHAEKSALKKEFDRVFPHEWSGYERWFAFHQKKHERVIDCLGMPYQTWWSYFNLKILRALPYLQVHRSVMSVLGDYFQSEDLKMSMAFQAKYLGMSPWHCPGTFTILPFMEHKFGISHYRGGVNQLSQVMARIFQEEGGKIHLSTEAKQIIINDHKAVGVELQDGRTVMADEVIMNADFADGMQRLIPEVSRPSYTDEKLAQKEYSCSTFMLYLGVDKKYDIPHHNIFFGAEYKKNLEEISDAKVLPQDPAFYIQNACITDSSLAPEGKSTIYVLVPVPNKEANIDWTVEKEKYRDLIIQKIEQRTELKDISKHIEVERIITPDDWKNDMYVYRGAVFNLAHTLQQMLYLRPHNKYDDIDNFYIVGGGTHPGSGLPTILESGRIAADLISKKI